MVNQCSYQHVCRIYSTQDKLCQDNPEDCRAYRLHKIEADKQEEIRGARNSEEMIMRVLK